MKVATELEIELTQELQKARKTMGLTQKQLSDKTGISQADISRMESGTANPSIRTLQRIADAMDMTLRIEFLPKD